MPPKARTAKSVRFRSGSPDTLMISSRVISEPLPTFDNDDAMAIDEPLPGLSSLTAGHQTWELPSQTPVTIPQTVESLASYLTGPHTLPPLHALAPMWESPPASPASMLVHTTPAQPPLTSLALAWQSPSLSPASDPSPPSMAPLQLSNVVSPLQLPHPVTMLAGPQISVCIPLLASSGSIAAPLALHYPNAHVAQLSHISSKFSHNFKITQMNIEHPTAQLDKAQQLALLLTDVSKSSPATVDPAQDGPIIAAYNHYTNTLVEASWQYWLLLERRAKLEAMMQEFQNDNITDMETKELDNL
ncbi:hypothetical protein J3A83DRAFT_4375588 [Scleroderma citrinum]